MRYYKTIKSAHSALCLDCGFDPFPHGGMVGDDGRTYRKMTNRALRACGYPVDPSRAEPARRDFTDLTTARHGEIRNGWTTTEY